MRRRIVVAAVITMSSLGLASAADAQERKGFWFDFGIGMGSVDVSAGGLEGSREAGQQQASS